MNGVVLLRDALNSTLRVLDGTWNRTLPAKRSLSMKYSKDKVLLVKYMGICAWYRTDMRINELTRRY